MKYRIFAAFFACIAAFTPVMSYAQDAPTATQEDQAAALDKLLKEFKDAREVASMQAYEAGSQADQFLGQSWTDYQQAIRKQEMYQEQVKLLDEKIKQLEQQKAALPKK